MTHEPGSPGRVFLLDENDVVDMLAQLEDATKGAYRWSETAGLKQLIRSGKLWVLEWAIDQVAEGYPAIGQKDAA